MGNLQQVRMTSLELVDFINNFRRSQASNESELLHKNFLAKVPEVLGKRSAEFLADLPDGYGRPRKAYRFPKREACLMAMSYSYEIQAAVFDRMTVLEQQAGLPQSYPEALRALADATEHKATLEQKLETDRPKVLFAESVETTSELITIARLANILKQNDIDIGERRLYGWMRDNGYIYKDSTQPTQKALELKVFRVVEQVYYNSRQEPCIAFTTKVTGKGQQYFVEKFLKNGVKQ